MLHSKPDASFRIKDSFQKIARTEPVIHKRDEVVRKEQVVAREAFGEENVVTALEDYIGTHEAEPTVAIALKTHRPEVKGEAIIIYVDNQLQMEKLEALKQYLHNALMKKLNNGYLALSFKMFENNSPREEKKLFTSSEKFEHFVKLNPVVVDLKNIFGLEIE